MSDGDGGYEVEAGHTYFAAGDYPVNVTITGTDGLTAGAQADVDVAPAPIAVTADTIAATAGTDYIGAAGERGRS